MFSPKSFNVSLKVGNGALKQTFLLTVIGPQMSQITTVERPTSHYVISIQKTSWSSG
jgi:hypothetical protein